MSFAAEDSRSSGWYSYMKTIIRKYDVIPLADAKSPLESRELEAVRCAVEQTEALRTGAQRVELLRLAYWTPGGNLYAAADQLGIDRNTARTWSKGFIRAVARNFFGPSRLIPYKNAGRIREHPRSLW